MEGAGKEVISLQRDGEVPKVPNKKSGALSGKEAGRWKPEIMGENFWEWGSIIWIWKFGK